MTDPLLFAREYPWTDWSRNLVSWAEQQLASDTVRQHSLTKESENHRIHYSCPAEQLPSWIQSGLPQNVSIAYLNIFSTRAGSLGRIHRDINYRSAAFNIPIGLPAGSQQWYLRPFQEHTVYLGGRRDLPLIFTEEELDPALFGSFEPDYSLCVRQPTLVNLDYWHRTNALDCTEPRWVVSLRFRPDPSYASLRVLFDQGYRT